MNDERWRKIDQILQATLDCEPNNRAAFLDEACGGDDELRREVESLLAHEDSAEFFIETSAMKVVARSLTEEYLSGQRIGHYRIIKPIGEGGMGKVYLAEDEKLKRRVAIKFLPETFTADPERIRRFEQEARAASALNHPNIITIHEVGQIGEPPNDTHFIVTEFIEGRTLRELMRDTRLDVRQTLEVAAQIASALKAAHTAFIVHRDIKPENVMVRADGLVKVLDFGIAKLGNEFVVPPSGGSDDNSKPLPPEGGTTNLTAAGMILGTASYMSPEQARGESLDGRTDLFSLGLVLYEMATGKRLFAGATRADLQQALLDQQEPLLPDSKLVGAPKELEKIIRQSLRRRREERYATADEMLADLKKLQHQFDSRASRRMVRLSALVAVLALLAVFVAAWASVNEVWEEKFLRDGSAAGVRRAVFSPDGRWLIAVGEDNRVRVWDFVRRQLAHELTNHQGWVVAASFAPDGKCFATASWDQTVIVWDAATFSPVTTLLDHRGPVTGVAFSPDGKYLVSASTKPDERTVLWRVSSWEKVRDLPLWGGDWTPLLFAPREPHRLFTYNLVANVETGQREEDLKPRLGVHFGAGVAFSRDGSRAVTVDSPGVVHFIDALQWKALGSYPTHRDNGRAVAFSPDGKLAATGSEDIALWNVATQELITRWDYSSYVWSLTWSPDGRYLVSTHGDGSILLWDIIARERAANLNQHSLPVGAVAFAPDGQRVASGSEDRSIIIWNLATGHKEAVLLGHQSRINALAFAPDGKWLAAGDQSGGLMRWDVAARRAVWRQKQGGLTGVAISPDGRLIADSFGVYESDTGRLVYSYEYHRLPIGGVSFSGDGRRLATVGSYRLHMFDTQSWELRGQHETGDEPTVSFASDGKHLVTGGISGEVTLWQAEPLRPLAVLGRHTARVKQVVFSSDGQTVASAGDDKTIKLWDVSWRRRFLPRFFLRDASVGTHATPVLAIAFAPDGRRLVSGEHDRSVRLYTRRRTLWGWTLD